MHDCSRQRCRWPKTLRRRRCPLELAPVTRPQALEVAVVVPRRQRPCTPALPQPEGDNSGGRNRVTVDARFQVHVRCHVCVDSTDRTCKPAIKTPSPLLLAAVAVFPTYKPLRDIRQVGPSCKESHETVKLFGFELLETNCLKICGSANDFAITVVQRYD